MDNATTLLVVLAALAVMMAVFLFATARRRDTSRALKGTTPDVPADDAPDADRLPVPVGAAPARTCLLYTSPSPRD